MIENQKWEEGKVFLTFLEYWKNFKISNIEVTCDELCILSLYA